MPGRWQPQGEKKKKQMTDSSASTSTRKRSSANQDDEASIDCPTKKRKVNHKRQRGGNSGKAQVKFDWRKYITQRYVLLMGAQI